MKALVIANYKLVFLNCIVLVLFFSIFMSVLGWVFRKSSKEFYDHMKTMPLNN